MPRGFPRSSDGRQIKWHFRLLFYFHFVWKKKFNDVQLTLYIPQVIVFLFHHLVNQLKLFLSTSVLNSYFLYKSKKENPATNVHFSFSKIKKKKDYMVLASWVCQGAKMYHSFYWHDRLHQTQNPCSLVSPMARHPIKIHLQKCFGLVIILK